MGWIRDQRVEMDIGLGVGLGIRGWRWVGLGICKVGGVGSGSNSSPWISCSAVRMLEEWSLTHVNWNHAQ